MPLNPTHAAARRILLCSASLAIIASGHSPALADEATPVSGVTVTPPAEAQPRYKASRSISATRTDTPLIDVPQSVSVVPAAQIKDQAANNIGDAIRYVPGVFSAQGEGNRETLVFRGNPTTGDFFVDGVRDDVQTYRDLYNIERLEIFKGPNAMIFGRGGIGGVVNRVTRVAGWNNASEIHVEGGSFGHGRVTVDLGAAVSDGVALRLTGVYQDSGSYRDGVEYERWGVNPTASFRLGDRTLATIGYEHFEDDRIADRGVPAHYLAPGAVAPVTPLDTPEGQFFGDPEASPTWTDTDAFTVFVDHQINDNVSIRNRTRLAGYDKFYQNVFPGAVDPTETSVSISAYRNASERRNFINQTDLNARMSTGAVEHTLLLGAEFGRQESENFREEGRFANGAFSMAVPVSASRFNAPITWEQTPSSADNEGVATVAAVYVQDQIALGAKLELIAGVRFESFNTQVTDRRTVGFPAGQQRDFDVTDNLWSPRLGVIYKPAPNASLYASYSRTYQPRGGDQLTGLSLSNQNLAPEEFQNYEVGAKWDVLPTFNLAAAVFQLDRDNVLALSDPNNAASPLVPVGRQRTTGLELSAAGDVTDRISIIAAYTWSDGEFLDSLSGTVKAGAVLPNMPRHSASLWTRYDATDRLAAAVGVIHQGERLASADNLVVLPSYTRVDAALFYDINDRLSAQLNVENLLGEEYFVFAHSNNNITPGSPIAFKAGLSARF